MKFPSWVVMSVALIGCTIRAPADPIDVRALERYQHLRPGTRVVVALNVGVTVDGVATPSLAPTLEQEGQIARISEDTVSLVVVHGGQTATVPYAGRMIREIRVLANQPNKALEPTPGSVMPRAEPRVTPAPVVAHL